MKPHMYKFVDPYIGGYINSDVERYEKGGLNSDEKESVKRQLDGWAKDETTGVHRRRLESSEEKSPKLPVINQVVRPR